MAKVKRQMGGANGEYFYGWRMNCPGCGQHVLPTDETPQGKASARWTFNGDVDKPVFSPSVLCTWDSHEPPVNSSNYEEWKRQPWPQTKVAHRCHSFIGCNGAQPGQIIFLGDCTHKFAGQVMDLPDIDVEFNLPEIDDGNS